jgi:hypothetical protein
MFALTQSNPCTCRFVQGFLQTPFYIYKEGIPGVAADRITHFALVLDPCDSNNNAHLLPAEESAALAVSG